MWDIFIIRDGAKGVKKEKTLRRRGNEGVKKEEMGRVEVEGEGLILGRGYLLVLRLGL
jgi:hypothetical protein